MSFLILLVTNGEISDRCLIMFEFFGRHRLKVRYYGNRRIKEIVGN
jgi:hypothetical protein